LISGRLDNDSRRAETASRPIPILKKHSVWQDLETAHIDRALIFLVPALFVLFNAIYWAMLINGGKLKED
jgi:hypothetical protein